MWWVGIWWVCGGYVVGIWWVWGGYVVGMWWVCGGYVVSMWWVVVDVGAFHYCTPGWQVLSILMHMH